jgi:hypothetical protein
MKKHELLSDVFLIEDFWSSKMCEDFIRKSENIGYEPAKVDTDKGSIIVEVKIQT